MEQEIRFCTTSDGIRIAYSTLGLGHPLVYVNGWPEHLEIEWEIPSVRAFLKRLAEGSTLIRYDMRGSGLSDRDVSDFSLEALIKDLEGVIDHLALDRFALLSLGALAGPIAMSYAAARPERISHLILYSAFLRGGETQTPERQRALIDYTAAYGDPVWGTASAGDEKLQPFRQLQKVAASPEMEAALMRTNYSVDVSHLAGRLTMPALVLHARQDPAVPIALGRALAIRLPHCKFVSFEGSSAGPLGVSDIIIPEISGFLGAAVERKAAPSDLRTVLFTDLVGHTEMMSRLGDERGRDVLREHERITREVLKANGGTEVKTMGDGFMASFGSVTRAVECAVALQRAFDERNQQTDKPTNLAVRCGLNAGEPIEEDGDLFGATVILASRIAAKADGGEILVADTVRGLCSGKGFVFADRGEFVAKGFEEPVRVYEVRWRE